MRTAFPYLSEDKVTFTEAQWEECDAEHHSPVFGCPVCFLFLAEKEPYAEMVMLALQQIVDSAEADEAGLKYGRTLLEDISSIPSRVQGHLRQPKNGGAA